MLVVTYYRIKCFHIWPHECNFFHHIYYDSRNKLHDQKINLRWPLSALRLWGTRLQMNITCKMRLAAYQCWEEWFSGGCQWVSPMQIHGMWRSCTPQIHHTHISLGESHDTFYWMFEDRKLRRGCNISACHADLIHELYRKPVTVVQRWMVRLKRDLDVHALFRRNAALYWHYTENAQPAVILGFWGIQEQKTLIRILKVINITLVLNFNMVWIFWKQIPNKIFIFVLD